MSGQGHIYIFNEEPLLTLKIMLKTKWLFTIVKWVLCMYPIINRWFSDLITRFNTATFFCLSPARTGNYQRQWCGLFYVQ